MIAQQGKAPEMANQSAPEKDIWRSTTILSVRKGHDVVIAGDGSTHILSAGGLTRVDAATPRGVRNVGQDNAVIVVAGGKDGYVGRDGQAVGDNPRGGPPGAAA